MQGEEEYRDRAIQNAINELKRWQYSSDVEQIRHSIDAAIRMLQRA